MKRFLSLFSFVVLFISLNGQELDKSYLIGMPYNAEGRITYSKVIEADSISAEELYLRAEEWFSKTYNSANHVLQVRDKDAGILIGNGIHNYQFGAIVDYVYALNYNVKIELKNGRYKYTFSDLYIDYGGGYGKFQAESLVNDEVLYKKNGKVKKNNAKHKVNIIWWALDITSSLRVAMAKEKTDDW